MVPVVYISAILVCNSCNLSNLETFPLADWEIGNKVYISMIFLILFTFWNYFQFSFSKIYVCFKLLIRRLKTRVMKNYDRQNMEGS